MSCAPVTVCQIREKMERSDSRVRSHVAVLLSSGYLCCVGTTKVRRYVPSVLWMEEQGLDLNDHIYPFVGGQCEVPGCSNPSEDVWCGRCLCRDCMMGKTIEEDVVELRRRMYEECFPGSPGEMMLDEATGGVDRKFRRSEMSRRVRKRIKKNIK